MLTAGLTAPKALEQLQSNPPSRSLREPIARWRQHLSEGASVGDAVAGIIIVFINIIGGIIVAVVQHGMSFADATKTFTLLSVGDGLVAQMPALIVSTAAGLMVSKAGVEGSTDRALAKQLSFYPQALGMAAAAIGTMMGAMIALPPASVPSRPTTTRTETMIPVMAFFSVSMPMP